MSDDINPEDALRDAGFAVFHRDRPKCPQCGWDTRPTEDAEICDICGIVIAREAQS